MSIRRCKLSKKIQRKLVEFFVLEVTARSAGDNALDVSEFKHHRINHSQEFAIGRNHINGIENFWNQAKRVLRKYNGVPKKNFNLFLKECEFRFNYGSPKNQMNTLSKWAKLKS